MKTTTVSIKFDYSNLSDEQLKAVAILQHTGDDLFILDDKIFQGDINEALEAYNNANDCQLTADNVTDNYLFYEYCLFNCTDVEPYDEDDYNKAYMCLTDDEATAQAESDIKNSLWAFNADFILSECNLSHAGLKSFQSMLSEGCEDANDFVEALIDGTCGMDNFMASAISADGRAHFMNTYDGNEDEETVNGETYYIYRMS